MGLLVCLYRYFYDVHLRVIELVGDLRLSLNRLDRLNQKCQREGKYLLCSTVIVNTPR